MIWAYHYLDKKHTQVGISWFDSKKQIPKGYGQLAFGKDGTRAIALNDGTAVRLYANSKLYDSFGTPNQSSGQGRYGNSALANEIARRVAPIPKAVGEFALAGAAGGVAGGVALTATGALSGSGLTTLGLAEEGAGATTEAAATLLPQFSNSTLNK